DVQLRLEWSKLCSPESRLSFRWWYHDYHLDGDVTQRSWIRDWQLILYSNNNCQQRQRRYDRYGHHLPVQHHKRQRFGSVRGGDQTITLNHPEAPAITCPADIATSTEPGTCSAHVAPGTATATDNCGSPTVTGTRSDGRPLTDTYPRGTTTITWTATDSSGTQ